MEKKDKHGKFYDKAKEHCLSIGFDTTRYCGVMNGCSYYYLYDDTLGRGYYGTYIIKFNNKTGKLTIVEDIHEILKAFNMSRGI